MLPPYKAERIGGLARQLVSVMCQISEQSSGRRLCRESAYPSKQGLGEDKDSVELQLFYL